MFKSFQEFKKRYPIRVTDETLLGSGTYGKVVKVEDQVETEWVAVKISEFKGSDPKSLKAEVELAQKVPRQANIARYDACYRIETDMGLNDFAIMKYYPDGNLADLMKKNILTLDQKEDIIRGILLGLQHLHRNRIVHRDFKPANILISRDNRGKFIPKIADFGLSKLVENDEIESSDFDLSDGRGTPLYKAPEQIEGERVSFNLDLWAFGVILFELITGEKLFYSGVQVGSEQAIKREIEKKIVNVILPENRVNDIAEPYRSIIRRCLVKDIHKRVRKEEELIELLDGITQLIIDANQLLKFQKFEEAKLKYEAILNKHEQHSQALVGIKTCIEGIQKEHLDITAQKANALYKAKQWQEASILYVELLIEDKNNAYAQSQLKLVNDALSKQEKINILLKEAESLFLNKNHKLAKNKYEEILRLEPTNTVAKQCIVRCEESFKKSKNFQIEEKTDIFEKKTNVFDTNLTIKISKVKEEKKSAFPNKGTTYIPLLKTVSLTMLGCILLLGGYYLWFQRKDIPKSEIIAVDTATQTKSIEEKKATGIKKKNPNIAEKPMQQAKKGAIRDELQTAEVPTNNVVKEVNDTELKKQQNQLSYDNLIEKGILAINNSNNKQAAIVEFSKARSLADTYNLSTVKATNTYRVYLEKGNRIFDSEEYDGAKAWYLVAQSLINTTEISKKIKECNNNL